MTIRDNRLYRESHKTFETYCRERWNMSRPGAYQLIETAEAGAVIHAFARSHNSSRTRITSAQAASFFPNGSTATIPGRICALWRWGVRLTLPNRYLPLWRPLKKNDTGIQWE